MQLDEKRKLMCLELEPIIMKSDNEWAKGFISDMIYNTKSYSLKVISRIEELYGEYVNGDVPFTRLPRRYDYEHASARRLTDGWALFIGEKQIGSILTRDDSKCIGWFLSEAWDDFLEGITEELRTIEQANQFKTRGLLAEKRKQKPF